MKKVLVTGSGGLIGSEAVRFYCEKGDEVYGVDCDFRAEFFGEEASIYETVKALKETYSNYVHFGEDVKDFIAYSFGFTEYGPFDLIVHCAAQPSHDWAKQDPLTDFEMNAETTLWLLEETRQHSPDAVFVFLSTNKVYGDNPNKYNFVEESTRYEFPQRDYAYFKGINEYESIDQCTHSVFGASKLAADIMVQEYGRYFGMKTVCFRGGCLTGSQHKGAELHGFLSYLVKCCVHGKHYKIYGYGGKQVRDNIHAYDVVTAIDAFYQNPKCAAVYNIGGGHFRSVSILEAIDKIEHLSGKKLEYTILDEPRVGDHICYYTDMRRFQRDYPEWKMKYSLDDILKEMVDTEMSKA